MSDYSEETHHSDNVNYENCIVTRHDDSMESCASASDEGSDENVGESNTYVPAPDAISPMNITAEQIAHAQLNPYDTLLFLLAFLRGIDHYLNSLEDNHRKWLQDKINVLRTTLIHNCTLFNVNVVQTFYDNTENLDHKKNINAKKQGKKNNEKFGKDKLSEKKEKKSENCDMDVHNYAPANNATSNRRCSQRLQNIATDKPVVYLERFDLRSASYKLFPATVQEQAKRKQLNGSNGIKSKTADAPRSNRDKAAKKSLPNNTKTKTLNDNKKVPETKNKNCDTQPKDTDTKVNNKKQETGNGDLKQHGSKGVNKRFKEAISDVTATNKNHYTRNAKSLAMQGNNKDTVENKRTISNKRRAASLDRNSKRVKSNNSSEEPQTSSTSLTKGPRRKLYSPDEWLNSPNFLKLCEA